MDLNCLAGKRSRRNFAEMGRRQHRMIGVPFLDARQVACNERVVLHHAKVKSAVDGKLVAFVLIKCQRISL